MDLKKFERILTELTNKANLTVRKETAGNLSDIVFLTAKKYDLCIIKLNLSPDAYSSVGLIDKNGSNWAIIVNFLDSEQKISAYGLKSPDLNNWDADSFKKAFLNLTSIVKNPQ